MMVIKTEKAPTAIGPYSQAIQAGNLIFTSGQLPVNPQTGEMPEDPAQQTRQSMENVQNILKAAGSDLSKAIKITIFLQNMEHFSTVNSVYEQFFQADFPARSCIQVARLPKDALIEIEAIATI